MAHRRLLVPVRGDGKGDGVMSHAAALARRFRAHIAVVHCRARAEDLLPYGVPIPSFLKDQLVDQAGTVADAEEAKLREELKALATKLELVMKPAPERDDGPTVSWTEEQGKQVDVIRNHGRLSDLIVVAQPDVDRNLGANTLKAALFHTGRPVMMCPPVAPPAILGAKVAIAWNGSLESARAVALTRDILAQADEVTVLTSGEMPHSAVEPERLLDYLALRGTIAKIDRFDTTSGAGHGLLSRVKALDADMLIMGAYGQSHERETLFGGNTQSVVDTADLPVILVH